jgi:hypothetical protein
MPLATTNGTEPGVASSTDPRVAMPPAPSVNRVSVTRWQRVGAGLPDDPRRILVNGGYAASAAAPELLVEQAHERGRATAQMQHSGRDTARLDSDRHRDCAPSLGHLLQQRCAARDSG